jgi:hypothetical protein
MYNPQLAEVRYIDHLFSIYIKSMGRHTVCRLEEREHPTAEKPTIEFVNGIFNPSDRFERKFAEQDSKLNEINDTLRRLANDDDNNKTITESSREFPREL